MDPDDQKVYQNFRSVVGAVILAFIPLSMNSLSCVLHDSDISLALSPLHSLLLVPEGIDDSIHIFHKSFPDFLTDPNRCQDPQFFVDPSVHHGEILLSCLHLMEEKLKRNICNLDDYTDLSSVDNLSACRKKHIGDGLGYACQFWTKHLVRSPIRGHDAEKVQQAIEKFFTTHLLFWIEVLVVMKSLDLCVHSINDIQQWYTLVGSWHTVLNLYSPLVKGGNVCKWADESQQLILRYFDIISNSPSQIYCSALPLFPPSSWLYQSFSSGVPQGVKVVAGLQTGWEVHLRTVSLSHMPLVLAYWENIVVVGLGSGGIIILDESTGIQTSTLSGHGDWVRSLIISSDGACVVSGSDDKSVKLWEIQTGALVKTFLGHTCSISSVSISTDMTLVTSGSWDCTVCLWDVQTGECQKVIKQSCPVTSVAFSPTDPRCIISASQDGIVQTWDINGCQNGPSYEGTHVTFSPSGLRFILWGRRVARVYNPQSSSIVEFQLGDHDIWCCCFSPDERLVAGAAGHTIYLWDITGSKPNPFETHVGHTSFITSMAFSSHSHLILASDDKTVKFWQIGGVSTKSVAHSLATIKSITLQTKKQLAISSDLAGAVKIWNLSTGQLKTTFQTGATGKRDLGYLDDRLIMAWYGWKMGVAGRVYVLDVEKGEVLRMFAPPSSGALDIKISGDGSKVFLLDRKCIQAWSIQTGELVGKKSNEQCAQSLVVDGSRVWLSYVNQTTHNSFSQTFIGWDFQAPGLDPIQLDMTPDKPQFDFIDGARFNHAGLCYIQNTATGRIVFYLPEKFLTHSVISQWDGQYLVIGYLSGEVVILHFDYPTV